MKILQTMFYIAIIYGIYAGWNYFNKPFEIEKDIPYDLITKIPIKVNYEKQAIEECNKVNGQIPSIKILKYYADKQTINGELLYVWSSYLNRVEEMDKNNTNPVSPQGVALGGALQLDKRSYDKIEAKALNQYYNPKKDIFTFKKGELYTICVKPKK